MIPEDIQTKKMNLITWILQLQDISIIEKIADLQSADNEVPQWHIDIVRKRIQESKENPERLLNWDDVKDNFIFD